MLGFHIKASRHGEAPLDPEVSGLAVPFHTGPTFVRRAATMQLSDPRMRFAHPGKSSLVGKFAYSGP
ncbi:MAG: hypothetical protein KDC18_11440 [Alphaproteobacteria bacterium]|nr:hypothetical protein [Alphaproteobacteria bacterium]MCB9928982.1 hypothetical protein [Alphaproteobacteria bacterium]